jgi:hypothetical protein
VSYMLTGSMFTQMQATIINKYSPFPLVSSCL